ncbi:hypothetical protein F4808DRAFT_318205 [Astrocystis sublimbata]|nr:hypothetical protein F4808DRAFT_318205 [Astrocystis sublimbata]
MSYPPPNFVHLSQLANLQQYSRSPPNIPIPIPIPISRSRSSSTPRRLRSPPPCSSPLLHAHQPTPSPPYEYLDSSYSHCTRAIHHGDQRCLDTTTTPSINHCSSILGVELAKAKKKSPAVAAILERMNRYPTKQPEPIPYILLLQMCQHLYGGMLDSVKVITRNILRIRDPDEAQCKATIYRFDKRDTWREYKSRPGPQEHFYCAPHVEVTLPFLPTRTAAREIIEAIHDTWTKCGRHMRPAYKFRTQKLSWKFEPGMVYESTDPDHLVPRLVMYEEEHADNSPETEYHGDPQNGSSKLITYPDQASQRERPDMKPGNLYRTLEDVKQEVRCGPNKSQCKETTKSLLANAFGLDIRRIVVKHWIKEVQLNHGRWYPWGSLDNTYGLVVSTREVVQYNEEDAKRNARRCSRSTRAAKEKEPRDIAPTLRIMLPVERTQFAKDEENVGGLRECVEEIRLRLSTESVLHSRAAFCISWKKERKEFADWFAPQVIYKPNGDGDDYTLEGADGCDI